MKITFKTNCEGVKIIISYSKKEWEFLEDLLGRKLNLEKREVRNLWGLNKSALVYVSFNEALKNYLVERLKKVNNGMCFIDDVNKAFFENGCLNIGFFRIVPDEKNEVEIYLNKFLTILDVKEILLAIKNIYEALFQTCLEARAEIKIS